MSHDDIAAWEGFAVALAGTCAVLAGLVLLAILVATANAWVLLVEVVRDVRYSPIDEGTPSRPQEWPA